MTDNRTAAPPPRWRSCWQRPRLNPVALPRYRFSRWWSCLGLIGFGVAFALNSAVHSFLILHYAEGSKVAMNVGFYYMANAAGRLAGTVLSGLLYQWQGLEACLGRPPSSCSAQGR